MSPSPAPDPTSQQWPNLVWKRATMGEPTGPLISRRSPHDTLILQVTEGEANVQKSTRARMDTRETEPNTHTD